MSQTSDPLPPTRWEGPTDVGRGYGRHFADLIASGADVEGEARLADALAPRGARILDAGSGMGRIGAALRRAGHDAYGVDLDAGLIEQSRAAYPDLPVAQARLEQLDADFLAGHPEVARVIHPAHHKGVAAERTAKYLQHGHGGLVGFELKGGADAGARWKVFAELLSSPRLPSGLKE